MNTDSLVLAIIGHLVGDYLGQNDWMALNKKKPEGELQCNVHCLIWTICVSVFAGWATLLICGILYATHYIQDRTKIITWWMRLIGQRQFRDGPCSPWSIIVVDNVWHIVTLWAIWRFVA